MTKDSDNYGILLSQVSNLGEKPLQFQVELSEVFRARFVLFPLAHRGYCVLQEN